MWKCAVTFVDAQGERVEIVSSLEAVRFLDGWWQKVDGAAYQAAIEVCIGAVQGDRSHEDARIAVTMALAEGGIVVLPVH